MGLERLLRFPTILSDFSCAKQDVTRTSSFSDLNNTMLANPAVVPQGFEYASSQVSANNKFSEAISRPFKETTPLSLEPHSTGFWEKMSHRGISEQVAKRIKKSRRTKTLENYELAWRKWSY